MSNQVTMDHGIVTSSSNRGAERRLSLPARVNVLVVDGHNYAQVSNLLRKNCKPKNGEQQQSSDQPTNSDSTIVNVVNKTSQPGHYLSLSAIPEDIEHSDDSTEHITNTDLNNITVHSKDSGGFSLEEQQIVDDEDEIELVDPAPDGGYGWVIVLASFMCNLVVDGIAYTFGLFFQYFVSHFGASKGKTALAGSLLSGCYMSAGPIVSALTNRWGCRAVTMTGSVVSCIAFLLSAISPNIDCLLFTYGVLGGIGFGLIYLPAIVSVGYYFTTKRAFATGIAVCGSGVGAFLFAPLCQLALTYYDWRGALVLQAGLALNCAVFGALMRPLNVEAETYYDDGDEDENGTSSDEKQLLLANKTTDSYELTTNTEPGVQSVNDLNHIRVITPADVLKVEAILAKTTKIPSNDPSMQVTIDPPENPPRESVISFANVPETEATEKTRCQSSAAELGTTLSSDRNMNRTRARSAIGIGRYYGSRAFSDVNPPPLHIVLSSNPMSSSQNLTRRKSSTGIISQSIAVRPISKKDIFYSGSSTSVNRKTSVTSKPNFQENSNLVVPDSGNDDSYLTRASVVSIPAKDVIDSVKKEKEKLRNQKKEGKDGFFTNLKGKVSNFFSCCNSSKNDNKNNSCSKKGNKKRKLCCATPKILAEMVDFSLLREEPSFVLLSISNVFGFMGYYIPFVYIIQHLTTQVVDPATGNFVSREKAALILSTIGITNTIGRIIFGWISDKVTDPDKNYRVTALFINNICLFIAGLSVMAIPFLTSFYSILWGAIVFGSFISAYISLTSIIIVELVGLDKLTNAFGSICMFRGAAAMMGPPLAGSIYDFTGSFDLTFYAAGILLILSGLTSLMIPSQFKEKKK